MKHVLAALAAASLIVIGGLVDHAVSARTADPAAASASTGSPRSPSVTTVTLSNSSSTAAVDGAAIDRATEQAYAAASPSVVYIDNAGNGTGSGIVYDTKGDIVTNAHVVQGATTLKVTLSDGRTFPAQLVGTDGADDLAVIRIHASGLQAATFASSRSYHIAQTVLAIGSPLGLKGSVSSGLISGLGRVEQEPNGAYLPNSIQTSAPINPGNSGGALVTLSGAVVGMPTLEQTSSQDGASAQSIGFAIPSSRITDVANQIIATGKVQHTGRAYLGISPTDASGGSSFSPFGGGFGDGGGSAQPVSGAAVAQIAAGGPAAKAGVQQGDVITAVNGSSISTAQDLLTILAGEKPGNTISLKIDRAGSVTEVRVRLGELPA